MVKHYLISLPLEQHGATVHCYLMSNDPDDVAGAYHKLLYEAEQRVGEINAPILLSTELTPKGVKQVRKVLAELSPAFGKTLKDATDFHISICGVMENTKHNSVLIGMH